MTYGWHTSTYEWHTDDIRVHTSDIRVHTSDIRMTYEWHTNDIRVHTSDIRITHEYIRVTYAWHIATCEWHTDDMRFERKIKLTFLKLFDNPPKFVFKFVFLWFVICRIVKEFLACNGCFGLFTKIKKGSGISFWCTFSAWFFHLNALYLILCQLTKLCFYFFSRYQIKRVII